jgi:hypothetical protein
MDQKGQRVVYSDIKVIQCERCSKEFTRLTHLRRHFHNKKICKPILNDISIEELKEKYKVKKGCYKCDNCGKEYKSKSGKCKHKKKCSVNPIIIEKKTINILENELEKKDILLDKEVIKRKELEKQVEQLILEKAQLQEAHAKVINNDHSNTNNITTIGRDQNIIIVNNFGEENIEYLLKDENFIKKCIENPVNSISKYLENVHFNKEHPENRNIKITNLLGPYMDYIKEGKWNKIEKNILIPNLIDKSIDTIDNIIDYNDDTSSDEDDNSDNEDDEDKLDNWYDYRYDIKKEPKLKEKVYKKVNRKVYNESQNEITN